MTSATENSRFPLSSEQRDYLDLGRKGYGGVPVCARISGPLDSGALGAAARYLIGRHEPLRMRLVRDSSGVHQSFAPAREVSADWVTVPIEPGESLCPHLAEGPVREVDGAIRLRLLRESERRSYALALVDHLACDGWSTNVFLAELWAAYRAIAAGRTPGLPPIERTYSDYVLAQQAAAGRRPVNADRYRARIDAFAASATGLTRGGAPRPDAGRADLVVTLRPGSVDRLRQLATAISVPVNTVPLGCLALAARSMADRDCVGLSFVYSGRDRPGTSGLLGVFHRHVPLLVDATGGRPLGDFLAGVAGGVLDALQFTRPPYSAREFEAAVAERRDTPPLAILYNQVGPVFGQPSGRRSRPLADQTTAESVYAHFWPCRWQSYQEQRLRVMVGGGQDVQLRAVFNDGCADAGEVGELLARTAALLATVTADDRDRPVGQLVSAALAGTDREAG
jgi:hypothetical protein